MTLWCQMLLIMNPLRYVKWFPVIKWGNMVLRSHCFISAFFSVKRLLKMKYMFLLGCYNTVFAALQNEILILFYASTLNLATISFYFIWRSILSWVCECAKLVKFICNEYSILFYLLYYLSIYKALCLFLHSAG